MRLGAPTSSTLHPGRPTAAPPARQASPVSPTSSRPGSPTLHPGRQTAASPRPGSPGSQPRQASPVSPTSSRSGSPGSSSTSSPMVRRQDQNGVEDLEEHEDEQHLEEEDEEEGEEEEYFEEHEDEPNLEGLEEQEQGEEEEGEEEEGEEEQEEEDENSYHGVLSKLSKQWLCSQMTHNVSAKATNAMWDLAMEYIPRLASIKKEQNLTRKTPKFIQQRRKLFTQFCPTVHMSFGFKDKLTGETQVVHGYGAPYNSFQRNPQYIKLYEEANVEVRYVY